MNPQGYDLRQFLQSKRMKRCPNQTGPVSVIESPPRSLHHSQRQIPGPSGAENDRAGFSRTGPNGTAQSPGTSAQNQGRTGPGKRPKPAKPTQGPIGAEKDGAGSSRTGPGSTAQSPGTSAKNQGRTGPGKRLKPAKPTHVVMNPLDNLQDYELRKLLKSKSTEICSIEDPILLLRLLRDRFIIPEDKYKAITALADRRELSKALCRLLEGIDVTNSPTIRVFWNALFEDCILRQYPQLQHLYDSLSRCDDSKTKPLGLHTRVPPTVTAQHSVRKHCEAQTENVRDFRFSEQSDSEGAGTSSLKRDAETHAEGTPAKRVREDNKSLKKTCPLPIKKSPDFAALEQELSKMKQDLDTVKRERDTEKGERDTVKRERDTVKGELTTVKEELTTVTRELTTVKRERDTVKGELDTVKRELTTVKRERDTVKGELDTVKGELTTVKRERDTVKGELDTVKRERDTVKRELTTVKRERDTVKGELTTVKRERDTVKGELTTVKRERDTVKRELTTVMRERDTVKGELTTVMRERDTVKGELDTVKGEWDTVKRELTTVMRELTTVMRERDTVNGELTTVKRERDTVKGELTTVMRERDTVKGELTTVMRELDTVKGERDTMKGERDTVKDVPLNKISADWESNIYAANVGRCDKYALQIFKSLVNHDILSQWACKVNFHGNRGKKALPRNVIEAVFAQVSERFPQIGPLEEQAICDKINTFLRRPNAASQR